MTRIIFATGNQNKMREIREIMQGFQVNGEEVEILSMKEAGISADIVEDGQTFAEEFILQDIWARIPPIRLKMRT